MGFLLRWQHFFRTLSIPSSKCRVPNELSEASARVALINGNSTANRFGPPCILFRAFSLITFPPQALISASYSHSLTNAVRHAKRRYCSKTGQLLDAQPQTQIRGVKRRKSSISKKEQLVAAVKVVASSKMKLPSLQSPLNSSATLALHTREETSEAYEDEDFFDEGEDDRMERGEWEEEERSTRENSENNVFHKEERKEGKKKRVPRTNRGTPDRRHRNLPAIIVRKADIERLDQMRIEFPQALHYKLHTMDSITHPIIRSIKTHSQLYMYAPSKEEFDLVRECGELEEKLKSDVLGTCFYFRVIALPPPSLKKGEHYEMPTILTKCDMKPFVPLDKANGLTWELGSQTRGRKKKYCPFFLYHHPPSTPTSPPLSDAQRRAVDQIKKILLLHFSTCVIEPIEGELACDVTLYAKYAALYEKAAIFAHQFNKDLDDILKEKNIREFEHYGEVLQPSSKEKIHSLTPEEVALRMAAFLKSTIFSQHSYSTVPPGNEESGRKEKSSLRVILGIARTAVQAKLACDTEVAVVLHKHFQPEHLASQGGRGRKEVSKGKKEKSCSLSTTSLSEVQEEQFICVRSFYKHFRGIDDEKKFIGSFDLSQIPTVNLTFANFMKQAFNIEKVSQILEKKKELHFSLCRTTFEYCIRMGYGRMEFPHEVHTPLFTPTGKHIEEKMLEECAHNSVTLLNENRTALRCDVPRLVYTMNSKQSASLLILTGQKSYGRLVTNKKYVQAAVEAALPPIGMLFENHCSAAALCVEDRRASRRISWEAVSFPRTTNPLIILKVVRQLAEKMAHRRVINDFEEEDDPYSICVKLLHLESYNLLPAALEEGINAVVLAMKEACERRKEHRFQLRKIIATNALERPLRETVRTEEKSEKKRKEEKRKRRKSPNKVKRKPKVAWKQR